MIRSSSLMEQAQRLSPKIRTKQNQRMRMKKSLNGKPPRKKNSRTRRKRWKRRKTRSTRVHPVTVRLLERFPSTSNGLPTVASLWWNVLAVRERVRSPQSRAFSGSQHTHRAFSRRIFHQSAGQPLEKRTGAWSEDNCRSSQHVMGKSEEIEQR